MWRQNLRLRRNVGGGDPKIPPDYFMEFLRALKLWGHDPLTDFNLYCPTRAHEAAARDCEDDSLSGSDDDDDEEVEHESGGFPALFEDDSDLVDLVVAAKEFGDDEAAKEFDDDEAAEEFDGNEVKTLWGWDLNL